MNVLALLFLSAAATGADLDDGSLTLKPRYLVGQEITYTGTIVETITGREGVKYEQPYHLETTAFVLDVDPKQQTTLGCYTVVRLPGEKKTNEAPMLEEAESVHFDMLTVSPTGKAKWKLSQSDILLSAEGISPWELGFLLEMPKLPIKQATHWVLRPAGQPSVDCKFVKVESVAGVRCAKIQCVQQSQNWSSENIGQSAWQNETTCWWDLKAGCMYQLERKLNIRESADPESSHSYVTRYSQTGNLRYRGPIFQERAADFEAAFQAQTDLDKALAKTRRSSLDFARIQDALTVTLGKLYSTPYRPALTYLKSRAEQAEANPDAAVTGPTLSGLGVARLGKPARNFVMRDVDHSAPITLKKLEGTPVVLVVVNPHSMLSLQALSVAVKAVEDSNAKLFAVCTEMSDEIATTLKKKVPGEYTICTGGGFDKAYGVDATPHTLFVDGSGILRASFAGLGPEMYVALGRELYRFAAPEQIGEKPKKKSALLK